MGYSMFNLTDSVVIGKAEGEGNEFHGHVTALSYSTGISKVRSCSSIDGISGDVSFKM